jgi:hypothetical protein
MDMGFSMDVDCSMEMDTQIGHGLAAWTWLCSMDMDLDMHHIHEHGHAAWSWTCSMDMDMQHGSILAVWTLKLQQ